LFGQDAKNIAAAQRGMLPDVGQTKFYFVFMCPKKELFRAAAFCGAGAYTAYPRRDVPGFRLLLDSENRPWKRELWLR
jgi:hypothetical protein